MTTATATPEAAIRILKIVTCSSLSGKSKLTYHIGCTGKAEIQFRVYANSSTGFFSQEWITLSNIQQMFAKVPKDKAITSVVLNPLFNGKSINTPAFLFAALMNEALVCRSTVTRRSYDRVDPKAFMAKVKTLIAANVNLKATDKPKPSESKKEPAAAVKKAPTKPVSKK